MDYILLKEFFADYSLPVLIIALVIGVVKFFVDKFLVKNINRVFLSYAPFILCVVLYTAYDMLFVLKSFALTYQSLYAGLLSGSLSVIFCPMIEKVVQEKLSQAKRLSLSKAFCKALLATIC
jgi:flagellar biosynthesis protein FliQ